MCVWLVCGISGSHCRLVGWLIWSSGSGSSVCDGKAVVTDSGGLRYFFFINPKLHTHRYTGYIHFCFRFFFVCFDFWKKNSNKNSNYQAAITGSGIFPMKNFRFLIFVSSLFSIMTFGPWMFFFLLLGMLMEKWALQFEIRFVLLLFLPSGQN